MVVFGVLGLSQAAVAQLRLTEIQVVSVAGLRDEDGTAQPWVEIWNPSQTTKVAMNNYKLTDGTTTWTFPPADIMPDEHMIVWLSGKNRRVSTAPLHTDFTPKPGGGSISLLNAAATPVLLSQFDYPAQAADVSWGRDASDAAVTPTLTGVCCACARLKPAAAIAAAIKRVVNFIVVSSVTVNCCDSTS